MSKNDDIIQKLLSCHGEIYCILDMLDKLKLYDFDFTLDEIGRVMHITRERVRQIEQSAIKKLKHPKIGRMLRDYIQI